MDTLLPAHHVLLSSLALTGPLKQIEGNPALGGALSSTLTEAAELGVPLTKGNVALLFTVASGLTDVRVHRRRPLITRIASGAVETSAKVAGGVDYLRRRAPDAALDDAELDAACGAGVSFTDAQITAQAGVVVEAIGAALDATRYAYPLHTLLNAFHEGAWRWADGGKAKAALDAVVAARLGPRTPADDAARTLPRRGGWCAPGFPPSLTGSCTLGTPSPCTSTLRARFARWVCPPGPTPPCFGTTTPTRTRRRRCTLTRRRKTWRGWGGSRAR